MSLPRASGRRRRRSRAASGATLAAVAGEGVGAVVVRAASSTSAVADPRAGGRASSGSGGRGRRRSRAGAGADGSLDGLLEVAVLDSELGLPEHDSANVGQVESRDTVVSRDERAGGDVALVTVGTAGQRTNEQSSVANVLAPVLDSSVEAGLANVAVVVVVELDPDVVEELADVERLRSIGEGALRSSSKVVPLAGVLGKVGSEALSHGQVAGRVTSLVVYIARWHVRKDTFFISR